MVFLLPRGGGHEGNFILPDDNLVFSFPDSMIATTAPILAFYVEPEKDPEG